MSPTMFRPNRTLIRPSTSSQIPKLFLQLPPSYRSFHATPRAQFLDSAIVGTHSILEGLHSITGLPWGYTLPLAALSIRAIFILPISIYSRRALQKQLDLIPLMTAWQHNYRTQVRKEGKGPVVSTKLVAQKIKTKQKELYARFGCGVWKQYLPFLQFPIWLVAVETIRKMCGAKEGLLKWISHMVSQGDGTVVKEGMDLSSQLLEPSFAMEGVLWFPNLLVSDPYLALPFMLSGSILLNLSGTTPKNKWLKRLTRSMMVVSLAIIPLTLQMPSALLVYWTSSSLFAFGQAKMLDVFMPIKKPVMPCKYSGPIRYVKRPKD